MKIHAISTGYVKITENWRIGKGKGVGRLANALFDRHFTDWLPIYVWVIEHPEGLIVIDTGIPADANAPLYFPPFMPLMRRAAPFKITPEQEIGPQMRQLGLDPEAVRWVIMTHLHQDHDGGMHYFPNAEFLISRQEWDAATGFGGRMGGYLNFRWQEWLRPTLVDFADGPHGPFAGQHIVTEAGDLRLVPTPGHSVGHLSVILKEGNHALFFAGDVSYTEQLLLDRQFDGVGFSPEQHRATYANILAYAADQPIVYLPSHDPECEVRLAGRQLLAVNRRSHLPVL